METKRPVEKPGGADNAQDSVKCMNCGNTILLGSGHSNIGDSVECDVCHKSQAIDTQGIGGSSMGASSNEDY